MRRRGILIGLGLTAALSTTAIAGARGAASISDLGDARDARDAGAADRLPAGELQRDLDELVDTELASAALLRIREGRQQWVGAAGVADLSSNRPAQPGGYFRIGSVTKTFVATVILQLVDEGRLELDDPIDRHLPGVVPNGRDITVRQILNHTSGLYDYAHEPGYSTNRWRGAERFRTYRPRELLRVAFAEPPYFPPGRGWHYSNTNYIVAGLLVQWSTGNSYGSEIERRILEPLRLRQTSIPGTESGLPRPHAHGYTEVDGEGFVDASRMNPSLDWAAGEMISTTADLDRFLGALLAGELTSRESLSAMRDTVETGTDLFEYGLGLQRFDLPCGTSVYGHGGELLGYLTYATGADDGRRLTLSYNPYREGPIGEHVIDLFTTGYCSA